MRNILSRRTAILTSLYVLTSVSAAACGSKKGKDEGSASSKKKGSAAPTAAAPGPATGGLPATDAKTPGGAASSAPVSGKDLKVTVWDAGYKLTLGAMAHDPSTQTVSIAVEIENLMSANDTPYPSVWLEAEGAVLSHGGLEETKEVIAKQKAKNKLVFNNVATFDPAKVTLVMGAGDNEQSRVPLGGGGEVRTLEPVKQDFTGEIKIGSGSFKVKQVEVRWDRFPATHAEAPKDKAFLLVVGDLKSGLDEDTYATQEKFVLTLPDGSKNTPEAVGPDTMIAKTKTIEGFYLIFLIPTKERKYQGEYTLDIAQPWGPEKAEAQATPTKLTLK